MRKRDKKPSIMSKSKAPTPTAIDQSKGFWQENSLLAILLLILPFALYWQGLNFEYVLDDKIVISENNYVKEGLSSFGKILFADSFEGYLGEQLDLLPGGRYRPLSLLTFAAEVEFFGLNPGVGHFVNILLYALTGLLIFRLFFLLYARKNERNWLSLPFLTALLFILHPIHTEAIANIKGRDEILALLFSLLALYCSWYYLKNKQWSWLAGMLSSLFLAFLAKENALAWIAIIPLSLWWFTKAKWKELRILVGSLAGLAAAYMLLRYSVLGYFLDAGQLSDNIMNNPFHGLNFGEKYGTIMYTLGQYLKLLIYPHPLTHDYYPFQVPILNWNDWRVLLSFALHVGLLGYAIIKIRSRHIVVYCIWFYLLTLFIVSNILINVGASMNERFIYMPSLAFSLLSAWVVARWLPDTLNEKKGELNLLSVGLLMVLTVGYIAKNLNRIPDWRNPLTLNTAAVKYSPNSARAHCFMGVALYNQYLEMDFGPEKTALLDQLNYHFNRSLEIYPGYNSALKMKAGIAAEYYRNNFDLDALLKVFTEVLAYRKELPFIYEYLDYLKGRNVPTQPVQDFLYKVGYEFNTLKRRDYDLALKYLNRAHQLNRNYTPIIRALIDTHQRKGNNAEANRLLPLLNSLENE